MLIEKFLMREGAIDGGAPDELGRDVDGGEYLCLIGILIPKRAIMSHMSLSWSLLQYLWRLIFKNNKRYCSKDYSR